ncbi:MAG: type III-B CRISPR-associated protein Cas10/Cmr2 [Thermoguttaceae bacterium]
MSCDWSDLVVAYLHDPPDKALAISGHEKRACRYATLAAGRQVSSKDLHGTEDQLASSIERLPMPSGEALRVDPQNGRLEIVHPLSGQHDQLEVDPVDEEAVKGAIEEIVRGLDPPQQRFLALWRLLPKRLAELKPYYALLPADTRIPDHTIWHHLDAVAGLKAALAGPRGAAFLSFSLGPVQPFIEAARSVRDLWSGSMILSWLTFHGMLPVIERYGPTAVIFPSLRGIPLVDRWLTTRGLKEVSAPLGELIRSPCLPNRFLAVVPCELGGEQAHALAEQCRQAVQSAWSELACKVWEEIDKILAAIARPGEQQDFRGWAELWNQQIEGFFSVTTTVLPLAQCGDKQMAQLWGTESFEDAFSDSAAVRALADAIPQEARPGYDQTSAGRWQAQVEICARSMEASRNIRHVPPSTQQTPVPGKCSLMGTFEQMGPPGLEESRGFWETMAQSVQVGLDRIRKRERFCAVTMTKRFAPHFLGDEWEIDENKLRTPDTATVAAAKWLRQACALGYALDPEAIRQRHGRWSGQWLFWTKQDQGKDEDEEAIPDEVWETLKKARNDKRLDPPPAYYAILMMDGDHMGRWLSGEMSPPVEEVLHPQALAYFRQLNDPRVGPALKARRPLGPARHAAISQALANFALHVVPPIVEKHHGVLIYAGGDDGLAMLPAAQAVSCARELRLAFSGHPQANGGARAGYYNAGQRELLMMGPKATSSCGLAVAHYKEDLRFALREARRAEKAAKDAGRDALHIAVLRRSGEQTSALCPWQFTATVQRWVQAFVQGASDRWAYRLRAELKTLAAVSREAMRSELVRLIKRADERTKQKLGGTDKNSAGEVLAAEFDDYLSQVVGPPRNLTDEQAMEGFLLLCQTASFLARGRTQ